MEKYITYREDTGHRVVKDEGGDFVAIFHYQGPDVVNKAYGAFIAGCYHTRATLFDRDLDHYVVGDVGQLDSDPDQIRMEL